MGAASDAEVYRGRIAATAGSMRRRGIPVDGRDEADGLALATAWARAAEAHGVDRSDLDLVASIADSAFDAIRARNRRRADAAAPAGTRRCEGRPVMAVVLDCLADVLPAGVAVDGAGRSWLLPGHPMPAGAMYRWHDETQWRTPVFAAGSPEMTRWSDEQVYEIQLDRTYGVHLDVVPTSRG